MLVMCWMSRTLIKADVKDDLAKVKRLMRNNQVRRLPVLDGDKLVGIVTDRDVKRASASDATLLAAEEWNYLLENVHAKDIMTRKPWTVHMYNTIEEAALIMLENKVGGLPVVDSSGRVVAMITSTDIFRALISLSGITRGGVQFALMLPDEPGTIKAATDILRAAGGRMISILTSIDNAPQGMRKVFVRVGGLDRGQLREVSQQLEEVGEVLYILQGKRDKATLDSFDAAGYHDQTGCLPSLS